MKNDPQDWNMRTWGKRDHRTCKRAAIIGFFTLAFFLGLTAQWWDPYAHATPGNGHHGKPTPTPTTTDSPSPTPTPTHHHGKPTPNPALTPWGCIGDGCPDDTTPTPEATT